VRLGLLLPQGGQALLPRVRAICQPELGWDDARWQAEERAYLTLWQQRYSLPEPGATPNWQAMLAEAEARRPAAQPLRRQKRVQTPVALTFLAATVLLVWLAVRRSRG